MADRAATERERTRGARRVELARSGLLFLLGLTVALQLGILYAPSGGGPPPFPYADKVIHVGIFAMPVVLGLLLRLPPRGVVLVFAAHAAISEVVQAMVLPGRSGDPLDVLADLIGIALGVAIAWAVDRRAAARIG